MITPCYPNGTQTPPMFGNNVHEDHQIVFPSSSMEHNSSNPTTTHSSSFLYNLSVLRDKIHQVQSLAAIFISNDHDAAGQAHEPSSTAMAMPTMGTLIQEIIVSASSMMFSCQQMALVGSNNADDPAHRPNNGLTDAANGQLAQTGQNRATLIFGNDDAVEPWFGSESYNNCNSSDAGNNNNNNNNSSSIRSQSHSAGIATGFGISNSGGGNKRVDPAKGQWAHKTEANEGPPDNYDIIELDASDLLAKYTHYCQVCGKGFKRDANLRMHMRAHGDEYKSSAALSNPAKRARNDDENAKGGPNHPPRKYSCPHEGCRWNKNHAKFQPLKSMICVKNHYKRSHCPKMYVCKRCNRKQFSVLSDLRTHEKHCGDQKWQCSCGTTFSRKDKLMGHVALFVGHTPAIKTGNNTTMDVERR